MSPSPPFTRTFPVRFSHTDPAGYVFFPRFFDLFQALVEDWFTDGLGLEYAEFIVGRRLGLPTAHTECDFLRPCRLGERLELAVVLERIGRSSIALRFLGTVAGEPRVQARSVLVVVGLDHGRPVPIDDDLRARLTRYREACDAPAALDPRSGST